MTRTTSAKAYREETENGNIAKMQAQVREWLMFHGPATGREISRVIPGGHKRLSDLKKKALVKELPKVIDKETGKEVILWAYREQGELDWATPDLFPAPKPTRKALEEKIYHLEARCVELETIIAGYPTLMGLIYDKGYQTGREDESRGISVDI